MRKHNFIHSTFFTRYIICLNNLNEKVINITNLQVSTLQVPDYTRVEYDLGILIFNILIESHVSFVTSLSHYFS